MSFNCPNFAEKNIELRYENDVVCIYANKEGLLKLSELCIDLAENPSQGHIHLNSMDLLTNESKNGVIAIF